MNLKLTDLMILSLITATLALATSVHADENDSAYYTITKVQTHEITPAVKQATVAPRLSTPMALDAQPLDIDISAIVNIGEQVWKIVEANQPVANVTVKSADAMPEGVTNWQALAGWQAPQTRAFESTFINGFGMTVIDFQYQVNYIPGGTYQGQGQYLSNVTVVPLNVTVAWGYKFNAQVSVPSVTNAGTDESPVAAAEVQVQWTVDTVLKHEEQSAQYYLRGDGSFEAL